MTTHELARELLKLPNVPVTTYNDTDEHEEVTEVEEAFDAQRRGLQRAASHEQHHRHP